MKGIIKKILSIKNKAKKKLEKYRKKIENKVYKFITLKIIYPKLYAFYSRQEVEDDKVVFIEVNLKEVSNSFQLIYNEMKCNYTFNMIEHFLLGSSSSKSVHMKRCINAIKDIATAKYIFINDGVPLISACNIRKETKIVQTWHGCGAFKRFGYSTADYIFGASRKDMEKYPFHLHYSLIPVSSEEIVWAYEEAYNMKNQEGKILPLGVSRTDIFFNKSFINQAYQNLDKLLPNKGGKKIILYSPTFRGRVATATTPNMLNLDMLYESLGEEYIILIKHHPLVKKRPTIPKKYQEFAVDVTKTLSIEELICISDICISDYSSLIFEYSLFEKPMIFFAYDIGEYNDWRGFYYNYDEFVPGPIVTTNREIIECIKNIENYDLQKVKAFKEKFMGACDGNSTQRILQHIFGEKLNEYRRKEVLIGDFSSIPRPQPVKNIKQWIKEQGKEIFYNILANKWYTYKSRKTIDNHKVVFIEQTSHKRNACFKNIYNELSREQYWNVKEIYLLQNKEKKVKYLLRSLKVLKEIATARYIFVREDIFLMKNLKIRKESMVINLGIISLPVFKFRNSTLKGIVENINRLPINNNYYLPIASENVKAIFTEAFSMKGKPNQLLNIGVSRMDSLVDLEYQQSAFEKLYEIFPAAIGKQIILYAPKLRGKGKVAKSPIEINIQMLYEYLNEDYIVVVKNDSKANKISKYFNTFAVSITKEMSLEELMSISDICITDYLEKALEFTVTEKPMFFLLTNPEKYLERKQTYYDYQKFVPGKIVSNTMELVEAINNINSYDMSNIYAFKERYYAKCDGHATARLIDFMKK